MVQSWDILQINQPFLFILYRIYNAEELDPIDFNCVTKTATRIKPHPTNCTGCMVSPKKIKPVTAAKTASMLSRMVASVGGAYF
jgi:hypothetical protein